MSKVWVFFYGTFMSAKILRQYGLDCEKSYPAKISGYSLTIRPRVNLLKRSESTSYGGLALVKHSELASLYQEFKKHLAMFTHLIQYWQKCLTAYSDKLFALSPKNLILAILIRHTLMK